jgi:hypothetical protein
MTRAKTHRLRSDIFPSAFIRSISSLVVCPVMLPLHCPPEHFPHENSSLKPFAPPFRFVFDSI